jgi:hypothetical protein
MANNTILTLANIRDEVMLELGGSGIDVELVEADIGYVIRKTVRKFNHARPGHGNFAQAVTQSQQRYVIEKPNIQGIIRVEFVESPVVTGDVFDPFYFSAHGLTPIGESFAEYDLRRQIFEQGRRVLGVEPEWNAQKEGNRVILYVRISSRTIAGSFTRGTTRDNEVETGMQ